MVLILLLRFKYFKQNHSTDFIVLKTKDFNTLNKSMVLILLFLKQKI